MIELRPHRRPAAAKTAPGGGLAKPPQLSLFALPPLRPRMCNVFFALQPDAGASQQADRLLQQLRKERVVLGQPVEADRRHVTLRDIGGFFDQMPRAHFADAKAAAATVRVAPFQIAFDLLHSAKGQMLLRPSGDASGLDTLHRTLNEALIGAGMRRWLTWNFRPHMTLCYEAGALPERYIEPVIWTVREFVLIESLFGRHRHVERGRWPLTP